MSLLDANGKPTETKPEPTEEAKQQEEALGNPMMGIDPSGNLTLHIPLHRTNEIFARGMFDFARSEALKWYAYRAQEARKMQAVVQKGAFRQFADKMMGRK